MKIKSILSLLLVFMISMLIGCQKKPTSDDIKQMAVQKANEQLTSIYRNEIFGSISIEEGRKKIDEINEKLNDASFKQVSDKKQKIVENEAYLINCKDSEEGNHLDNLNRYVSVSKKTKYDDLNVILNDYSQRNIIPNIGQFKKTMITEAAYTSSQLREFKSIITDLGYTDTSDIDNKIAELDKEQLEDTNKQIAINNANAEKAEAAAKAEAKKEGVYIGMTKQQVLDSNWGKPKSINRTTTAYGTHEQWIYGGNNYLYFDNDKLTTIQN